MIGFISGTRQEYAAYKLLEGIKPERQMGYAGRISGKEQAQHILKTDKVKSPSSAYSHLLRVSRKEGECMISPDFEERFMGLGARTLERINAVLAADAKNDHGSSEK